LAVGRPDDRSGASVLRPLPVVHRQLVDDPSDPRLDGFRGLRDPDLRRSLETAHGLFVAEGVAVVGRLVRSPYPPAAVAVTPEREGDVCAELAGVAGLGEVPLLVVPRPVLDVVAGFPVHRGVLALGERHPLLSIADLGPESRTVVVLEECNDHENMGAIARTARALGADAMVLSPRCADPLYRRSVRVSMGEVFAVPYARLDPWEPGLQAVRSAGFTLLALTPAADALPIQDLSTVQRARPALLLGAEGAGLSPVALKAADARVVIPMRRGVDSLNVAAAAAVAFWELSRTD
jgi:tRNA G18 (ribose-2'-O)-methylase SpoU